MSNREVFYHGDRFRQDGGFCFGPLCHRYLNKCDLDGESVEVCPTDVVTLLLQPVVNTEEVPSKPALGA
jgi:hypothetical protein